MQIYENLYYETLESETLTISWDRYHEIEEKEEEQYHKICELEDDVEYYKAFVRKFVEEGNKENQTLEEAYSNMFEFYKEKLYDQYI